MSPSKNKKANFIHSCDRLFKLNLAHKTTAQAKKDRSDTQLMGPAADIKRYFTSSDSFCGLFFLHRVKC